MYFQTSSTIRELKKHSICQGYQTWTSSIQSRPVSWVEQIPKKAMEQENHVLVICISVKWETTIIEGNNLGCFFTQNQIKPVAEEERCPDTQTKKYVCTHWEQF